MDLKNEQGNVWYMRLKIPLSPEPDPSIKFSIQKKGDTLLWGLKLRNAESDISDRESGTKRIRGESRSGVWVLG